MNLMKRSVVKEATYTVCLNENETVCHALWSCRGASDVWACERSPVHKWLSGERGMFELWSDWFLKLSRYQLEIMAVVMRRIWLRRNGLVFDNKLVGPNEVFNQAVQCLTDFQLAQVKQTSKANSGVPISNKATHWKPPLGEVLKVNWDVAWKTKEDRSGSGVVIQDNSGEIIASLCCPRTKVQDAMVAEVYAL
ncbi:uncharacterized protein LOC122274559 [Carya illinoinensis]|uniref:uncharacterized protein LOC122274559 n=1 Tax=Carya illinoinensis TaxID=32201 RepID=UPI001C71856B|nr:uncharacterized protein LOC122274559 [Carya illinoinensis]